MYVVCNVYACEWFIEYQAFCDWARGEEGRTGRLLGMKAESLSIAAVGYILFFCYKVDLYPKMKG